MAIDATTGSVDLYWIPLGAGQRVVKTSGRLFESIAARIERRAPCDLFHSALVVTIPDGRFVIEMTPVPRRGTPIRGVVSDGAVGSALIGWLRVFRYEVRCWRDGEIPDIAFAVGGPIRLADDVPRSQRVVQMVASVPMAVWGRDHQHAGEMWNSNSVTSWVLTAAGVDLDAIDPPGRGRAPGWRAGIVVAGRRFTNC